MRKAVEHLRLSPGGGFHVVDTFASSKMRAGPSRRVRESLRGTWKNPPQKAFPPHACSKTLPHFEALYLSGASLRHRVVNKLLGRDARETFAACRVALSALRRNQKKALQEATNQKPFHSNKYDRNSAAHYLSSTTHSLSVSSNEREQRTLVCVAARSRRRLL